MTGATSRSEGFSSFISISQRCLGFLYRHEARKFIIHDTVSMTVARPGFRSGWSRGVGSREGFHLPSGERSDRLGERLCPPNNYFDFCIKMVYCILVHFPHCFYRAMHMQPIG